VYGSQADELKLNDVLDCVCALAVAPEEAALFGGGLNGVVGVGDAFLEDEAAHHPPHSAVPRLHALLARRAPPPGGEAAAEPGFGAAFAAAAPALRAQCLQLLSTALGVRCALARAHMHCAHTHALHPR
jgi:hypothetical protein